MPSSIGDWYGPISLRPCAYSARRPASMRSAISSSSLRGLRVGRLLGLDELALEQRDLLGIVELDDVDRLVDRLAESAC